MDWKSASTEQRKVLFKVTYDLLWDLNMNWDEFYQQVFKTRLEVSPYYEAGFRRGLISRKRANQIYKWLCREYPEHAAIFHREVNLLETKVEEVE